MPLHLRRHSRGPGGPPTLREHHVLRVRPGERFPPTARSDSGAGRPNLGVVPGGRPHRADRRAAGRGRQPHSPGIAADQGPAEGGLAVPRSVMTEVTRMPRRPGLCHRRGASLAREETPNPVATPGC